MLSHLITSLLAVGLLGGMLQSSRLEAKTYRDYKIDTRPLQDFPAEKKRYEAIYRDGRQDQSREELEEALAILEKVLKKHPKWLDGYWQIGSITFQLGSTYTEEKDHPIARKIFVKGEKATRKCLRYNKKHPLCQLMLGSNIGKIGTIDGIFASLSNAAEIERLWLAVSRSDYNFNFSKNVSMQGSVRYALGMFYRLIPDFFLLDWLFDVRGDIDKSIKYHRESIAIDGKNACATLMLAASLMCKSKGEKGEPSTREGMNLLAETKAAKTDNITIQVCVRDAQKLMDNPSNGCGYTTAKQQETDEEAFKRQQEKDKQKKKTSLQAH